MAISWLSVLILGAILVILRSLYRLYFHPLSHIPGPRLAAITHAVEFYYDVVCHGTYIWEVAKMHEKYGPIVRINPREIHIKDPHFHDQIYTPSSRKREKDARFVGALGLPYSMISTVGHELHRSRRAILSSFFSTKSILALSSTLQEKDAKLMQHFETAYHDGSVLRLDDGFAALTADIVSQYCWGISSGFLDDASFRNDIRESLNELAAAIHLNRFFPIIGNMFRAMPRWMLGRIKPGTRAVLDMQDTITRSSSSSSASNRKSGQEGATATSTQKTIFDALTDTSVPPSERSARRLEDEGLVMVAAGTETTARALSIASYYIFRDRQLLLKLRKELQTVMPIPTSATPSWTELEKLPYLNAVVTETLRLSHGTIFRSPRVAPTEALTYKNYIIPPKTPVSMSTYFVHMDPEIFPQPEEFSPERWVSATENCQNLRRFIVAFGRGSRSCLAINLATAELYMTLAQLVRRFDIELFETGPENIRIGREMGIGQLEKGDFAVRAVITRVLVE